MLRLEIRHDAYVKNAVETAVQDYVAWRQAGNAR
jgi:hypothetical protein